MMHVLLIATVAVVNADPYAALSSVYGDNFNNCEVWEKIPCASSLARNAETVDVPFFCDCIRKTMEDGKKIFDWILNHSKKCIVYNSEEIQYTENKCRTTEDAVHEPTQYRHIDSGCNDVVALKIANPITYSAPTATGGTITTSCRVSQAQGYTGMMPMDVYAVVDKEECQMACLKTRQTDIDSDDCLGYTYLENYVTVEINSAKPGRCYLFNAPGRERDCALPHPDTLHLITNRTLSFESMYDCMSQESAALGDGGEVGYSAAGVPVPLLAALRAQLTPIPSCVILTLAVENVARQRTGEFQTDPSRSSAQSCLKACYLDDTCKGAVYDTTMFSKDNTDAVHCWKYTEVPTELDASESIAMHYTTYGIATRPDGTKKNCEDLEFTIQGVGMEGSCFIWFKVEREIEMAEQDDQWGGAPGTEMASKTTSTTQDCMDWCYSQENCFGFGFDTESTVCMIYPLGSEGMIHRKANHVYYIKRVVEDCVM